MKQNILYAIIGALVVAVGVLGYLYYDASRRSNEVRIEMPNVQLK